MRIAMQEGKREVVEVISILKITEKAINCIAAHVLVK